MSDNLKWYVVRVVSGQEKKAKTYLENEVARQKLEDYVPNILILSEKVYKMVNGKKKIKERNLLPGYMILFADLTHGEVKHIITNIPGIIGFLGSGSSGGMTQREPVPLRQSEVNRIMGKVDENEEFEEKMDTPFIVGETVRLMDGAFKDFKGTVEEIYEDRKKLKVTVLIFERKTPVELDFKYVQKED